MRTCFIVSAMLLVAGVAVAQEGKPLYSITAVQGGDTLGVMHVEMFPDIAPRHVRNFDSLVAIGFFDHTAFHRVVPNFVIQGGDPNSRSGPEDTWGYGDPSQATVPAEFSPLTHSYGAFSAARAEDINSATSQFFIVVAKAGTPGLDRRYSVYGRVVSGMEVADSIVSVDTVPGTQRPVQKIEMFVARVGTDTSAPAIPTLVMPANDTTRVAVAVRLGWVPVEGAVLYEVEVARDPAFADVRFRDSSTTASISVGGLALGLKDYYWRVKAWNGASRSDWSETRHFTTSMAAPELLSPATGSSIDVPFTLQWTSVPGATSYIVRIAKDLGMTQIVIDSAGIADTTLGGLFLPEGRYYWRVLADNGSYTTTSAARWNFTVGPWGAAPAITDASGVLTVDARLHAGQLVVRVSSERFGPGSVALSDVQGREVALAPIELNSDGAAVSFDASALPTGAYIVVARQGGLMATQRVVVALP